MTVVATDTRRVHIVDDAEDLRDLLRFGLERSAHLEVVGEAVDGIDAVEQARVLQPDLVFLDVAMPRMDGLQALPLIREAVPHVRVVVLSGFNEGTMAENARRAGADHYVVKGGPLQELVALAESL
jgi:DNA-binding NarL/FixJ family response regulator